MEWITTSTILTDLADFENDLAWRSFVARFHRPIIAFARRMGLSEADAEDTAQESLTAFAEGYRTGRYDRSKGRLNRWLFGIVYHQALAKRGSVVRRQVEVSRLAASRPDPPPDDPHATRLWDEEWERALLELCLHRVRQEVEPATMRAFEMVMQVGRTPAQAAVELGVPTKAVYNAKYTVLKRLRELRADLEGTV